MLDVGLAVAEHNVEGLSIPDLHRRRGVLLLEMGRSWAEADDELRQAIGLAVSQQARLHQLRALTARLRLARRHAPGEVDAAYYALAGCYGWFAEGLDAADLIEARQELAHRTCHQRCTSSMICLSCLPHREHVLLTKTASKCTILFVVGIADFMGTRRENSKSLRNY